MLRSVYRFLHEHMELANAVVRLFEERFVAIDKDELDSASQVREEKFPSEFGDASTPTSTKKQVEL